MHVKTDLIKRLGMVAANDEFVPVENMAKDMTNLEQYVENVINYTSKYNISIIMSYAPENLVGKYVKYPSYGDFPETYHLRTYGKWWKESEAFQEEYMPQDVDPLGAEDYVTLGFQSGVVPRHVCIYETYNPGAVVRIWGRFTGAPWKLLWEGPPQKCPEESRKFRPTIRKVNYLINEIRLEFNQSHLRYHTSIDAVLLGGYEPKYALHYNLLQKDLLNWGPRYDDTIGRLEGNGDPDESFDQFSNLPYEVIIHIFQYLDLMSLCRCAQVNKTWHNVTLDPTLYQNLSLKRYWDKVTPDTLEYFTIRCRGLKKIDLSWCGNEDRSFSSLFIGFVSNCCRQVTHLSLCHCDFVNNSVMEEISNTCKDVEDLRLRNTKPDTLGFRHLAKVKGLVALDLYRTNITDDTLIMILKANPHLKHINLDFCEGLERIDQAIETATHHNKSLTTWSSWKITSLTAAGAGHFSKFPNLKELDLGWCLMITFPGDSLERIAYGCRQLKRLIISQWRLATDQMLLPVIANCKELTQLDLLGIKNISNDLCERALMSLPKLKLLEISFCDSITNEQIAVWRQQYPDVTIQRSCQFVVTDYWN